MKSNLRKRLLAHIEANHPELICRQSIEYSINDYLNDKIQMIEPLIAGYKDNGLTLTEIEKLCFNELIKVLGPSKAKYIQSLLQSDFHEDYDRFVALGVLKYELVNMVELCLETFEVFDFNDRNKEDHFLRNAVIAVIHAYLIDFTRKQTVKDTE
uniref:hypothetical protein n=1 Tax=Pedobacter schmidteae TaxID=2201271 RepID=UPI000EB311DE|nr:hypothetical protein [Pedobacter schmidteae]